MATATKEQLKWRQARRDRLALPMAIRAALSSKSFHPVILTPEVANQFDAAMLRAGRLNRAWREPVVTKTEDREMERGLSEARRMLAVLDAVMP